MANPVYAGVIGNAFGGFSTTVDCAITTSGTGRALLAIVGLDSAAGGLTIDSCAVVGGASFTVADVQFQVSSSTNNMRGFYLVGDANVPSGSITVRGTVSSNSHHPWIIVCEYTGVGSITYRTQNNASSTTPSLTISSSSGNTAVSLSYLTYNANNTCTEGSGVTKEVFSALASNFGWGMLLDRDGASSTVNATIGGTTPQWGSIGFDLAPAVPPAPPQRIKVRSFAAIQRSIT